jgi:hypothetical protein
VTWHLMRTWYKTDATDEEPEYGGVFSGSIPDRAFEDGTKIVDVDWSVRGEVCVTYLHRGSGYDG